MIVLGIDTSCYTTSVAAADENGVNQVYALWNDGYGWGEPFALTAVQSSGGIGGFRVSVQRFVHDKHRNARSLRAFNSIRVGARRNHLNDFRIQRARSDVVNERLQIRARTRKQNADFQRLSHIQILSRCK